MRRLPIVTGVFVVMTLALGVGGSSPRAAERAEPSGRQSYVRYCGACHGPQAKGNGTVAPLLRPTTPDLTTIARRNGGEFPMERVVRTIDGRDLPHAHGVPSMPVWGTILGKEFGDGGPQRPGIERRVLTRVFDIAEYLRTIQEK